MLFSVGLWNEFCDSRDNSCTAELTAELTLGPGDCLQSEVTGAVQVGQFDCLYDL